MSTTGTTLLQRQVEATKSRITAMQDSLTIQPSPVRDNIERMLHDYAFEADQMMLVFEGPSIHDQLSDEEKSYLREDMIAVREDLRLLQTQVKALEQTLASGFVESLVPEDASEQ